MAHVHKRLKTAVGRCIDGMVDLRAAAKDDTQLAAVDMCIAVIRNAQADMHARIARMEASSKPARVGRGAAREQIRAPGPIEKPDYSPGTGVTQAKDRRERIVGDARNYVPDDDDDGLAPINPHAGPAEQIEEYLQGRRGGIYECEAAKEFVRLDTNEWRGMDDVERVAAIKARGDELRRSEDDGEAASPAAAPAMPDDGMF